VRRGRALAKQVRHGKTRTVRKERKKNNKVRTRKEPGTKKKQAPGKASHCMKEAREESEQESIQRRAKKASRKQRH
jgi:hypothetical protein